MQIKLYINYNSQNKCLVIVNAIFIILLLLNLLFVFDRILRFESNMLQWVFLVTLLATVHSLPRYFLRLF